MELRAEEAEILVRDNGIGIEPHLVPHVFEAFYKTESAAEGRQGLGVGLWLSRQLIEMLSGEITAHSEGSGACSVFRVRLPLHQRNGA